MATILPLAVTQFFDAQGTPLEGGSVYFYIPGTTTPKNTWQDSGGTILNTNPVVLNAAGEALIYGTGSYRQVVYDSAGNLVWDQLTADTSVGGLAWGGTSTGTPNAQVIAASSFSQQDGQQISFIVGTGLTNTGATTVAPGGGSGIAVLKDTGSGPTALTGGELVAGNVVTLIYDQNRGAFQTTTNALTIPLPVSQGGTGATNLNEFILRDASNTISKGYNLTPYNGGTISTGTYTPSALNGNYQYYTNNGAHTMAVPAVDSALDILVTNGASAGSITFSGYTVNSNTGEPLTTTNGNSFIISILRINGISTYFIKALQ